jgi:hypothetical protein
MSDDITEDDWNLLVKRIKGGDCTPFLGAGVNVPMLTDASEIAQQWAAEHGYPLGDNYDLARVAQFLSLKGPDRLQPKDLIREMFETEIRKLFRGSESPTLLPPHHLGILASLPVPVYITTNYDDLLFRALRANGKEPVLEVCPWNLLLTHNSSAVYPASSSSSFDSIEVSEFQRSRLRGKSYVPTAATPLVYHIHGHYKYVDSMVLTENDYLDFLVMMSRDQKLLPIRITKALTQSSLLFIGYSLNDPNFRVLFRGLIHPLAENRRLSVAIQLLPSDIAAANLNAAREYLTQYFDDINIKVFWGTADDFVRTLWKRWNDSLTTGA